MKMILTAGVLVAVLFVAVIGAVHAKEPAGLGKPTATPIIVIGE